MRKGRPAAARRRADPRSALDQLGRELLVRIMQELSRDAVLTLDPEGRITSWNLGAEELLGWTSAEAVGRRFDFLLPEDLKRTGEIERLFEATEPRGFLRDWETRRVTKDGRELHVALTRMRLLDDQGRLLGAAAILRDITPRKEMEEELLHAKTLAAIGEASARIAHEIRNPLTGMSNALSLLAADFPAGDPRARICEQVEHEIRRIDVVLDDLLTFARHRPLDRQRVDLVQLLEKVVGTLAAAGDLAGVEVRRYFPAELVIEGDPGMLEDSLFNLAQNAADAVRGRERATITLALKRGPRGVAITITDDGPGVPRELRRRIFDPFFTTKAHGTGLGLPVTKKHVEAHGGRLRVRSAADKRTTFEILLPAAEPGAAAPPAAT